MFRSTREFELFRDVTAAIAGATANKGRGSHSKDLATAHRAQDMAWAHVEELRIRRLAHRARKRGSR